jgi:hypothetical protein
MFLMGFLNDVSQLLDLVLKFSLDLLGFIILLLLCLKRTLDGIDFLPCNGKIVMLIS